MFEIKYPDRPFYLWDRVIRELTFSYISRDGLTEEYRYLRYHQKLSELEAISQLIKENVRTKEKGEVLQNLLKNFLEIK